MSRPLISALLFLNLLCIDIVAQRSGTIKVDKPAAETVGLMATVGNKSGGPITVDDLLAAERVLVNDTILVVSYDFVMVRASVKTKVTIQGSRLQPEFKEYIKGLGPGQIIHFKNIRCQDNRGRDYLANNIQFKISGKGGKYSMKGMWSY